MPDNKLLVILNNEPALEYDRNKPIPEKQRQYLDRMDERMNQGIQLGATFIDTPTPLQKAQYVANALINALLKQDFNLATAMCTFLGHRMPELRQVKCEGSEEHKKNDNNKEESQDKSKPESEISIEFIYDKKPEEPQQEQVIQFYKPDKPDKPDKPIEYFKPNLYKPKVTR